MRAILVHEFGDPAVMRLEEVADPAPGPGQVLVRVSAAGVNPVDAYRRSGQYGRLPALPWIPGSDAAGTIASIGDGVSDFREGDRVYTDHRATGAYAELMVCDREHVHPLPPHVSFPAGASLGVPYATAFRAVFQRGGAKAGEIVLVHGGTGGVGPAAIELGRTAGLTVIGTAGSDAGADAVLAKGAHHVLRHDHQGYLDELPDLTDGRGVDLVIEMLANVNLGRDLTLLARGGRVVVVGSRGPVEINPRDAMGRDADIRAFTLFNTPPDQLETIHRSLYAGLETGELSPLIAEELPLADAPIAHDHVMARGHRGKIVLRM